MSSPVDIGAGPDVRELLEVAFRIARDIAADAVWLGDRCNWVGAMPEEAGAGPPRMSYRALTSDLYGGSAGVGLFLAETAALTGEDELRRTALGALRHAVSRVDDLSTVVRLGLYAGRPGVALALAMAARALDEEEPMAAARSVAAGVAPAGGEGESDLMAGDAGAVVALVALARLLDDDRLVGVASLHGDVLLARAVPAAGGIAWPARSLDGAPLLTGLSHGAAGVALALLELATATGEDRFRSAAQAAFDYERAQYDPSARNWPDLRNVPPGGNPSFATFWCHGAPGGALARVGALELGGDEPLREEARAGLETTAAWVEAAVASSAVNYSLCHGLAGNAEILMEGDALGGGGVAVSGGGPGVCGGGSAGASGGRAPVSGGGDAVRGGAALAGRVAAAGIESYLERGLAWPSGALGGATPCLFLGTAGIGRFYLRLAQPELPSLLLVRAAPRSAGRPAEV